MKISLIKQFLDLHEWQEVKFSYNASPHVNQMEVELMSYVTGCFLLVTYLSDSEMSEAIGISQGIN